MQGRINFRADYAQSQELLCKESLKGQRQSQSGNIKHETKWYLMDGPVKRNTTYSRWDEVTFLPVQLPWWREGQWRDVKGLWRHYHRLAGSPNLRLNTIDAEFWRHWYAAVRQRYNLDPGRSLCIEIKNYDIFSSRLNTKIWPIQKNKVKKVKSATSNHAALPLRF